VDPGSRAADERGRQGFAAPINPPSFDEAPEAPASCSSVHHQVRAVLAEVLLVRRVLREQATVAAPLSPGAAGRCTRRTRWDTRSRISPRRHVAVVDAPADVTLRDQSICGWLIPSTSGLDPVEIRRKPCGSSTRSSTPSGGFPEGVETPGSAKNITEVRQLAEPPSPPERAALPHAPSRRERLLPVMPSGTQRKSRRAPTATRPAPEAFGVNAHRRGAEGPSPASCWRDRSHA
jgi:hypothetical protein